jgi:polysaccharide export outer membrane protein
MKRLFAFFMLLALTSCYTSKKLNYLQGNYNELNLPLQTSTYTVQPNDVLSIKVQSRDPDQANFFNTTTVENRNLQANSASLFLTGYTVQSDGTIDLAIVGELNVSNLNVEEIRDY